MRFVGTRFYVQVCFVVRTYASNACASWTPSFLRRYLLSFVHVLLMHMLHGYLLIFEQVFIVIRTRATNACASWTLAFMYKYVLSSIHMLLMHTLHGHLILFSNKCLLSSTLMTIIFGNLLNPKIIFITSITTNIAITTLHKSRH